MFAQTSPFPTHSRVKGSTWSLWGNLQEDYVRENSPPGPGVIDSFRGLAGISCCVIWVLQITTTKPRLSLSSVLEEMRVLESPVAGALQLSKDWA